MRVAIITENFYPKLDGVTRTIGILLEYLEKRGHPAIVFGPEGGPRRFAGAKVVPVPGVKLPFYPELRALLPRWSVGRRLARFQPDIVHLADPMLLGMAGLFWAHRIGAPVVAAYHTNIADYMAHFQIAHFRLGALEGPVWGYRRFLHNQCAATLCPSPTTVAMLRAQGFERVHLWQRGVDGALFTPDRRSQAQRAALGAGPDDTILLFVGRVSHEKNVMILAAAYRALARPGLRLVVVGDGPAREELTAALHGLPVTFTGYQKDAALADIYAAADCFLFPSTTETFGQAVQEAMASGLPVVGGEAGGVCDLVQPGVTGLLAKPNDTADFTRAARELLDDPARRARMGAAGRAATRTRTWDGVMDGLLALYAQIIAAPAMPAYPEPDPDDLAPSVSRRA